MTTIVRAVYEGGLFRPVEHVAIAEGACVELTVRTEAVPTIAPEFILEALLEIAALPLEGPNDGFSGADHDKILYGGPDAR